MRLSHTQLTQFKVDIRCEKMKLILLTLFSGKILLGFWILDVIIATSWPPNKIFILSNTHEFFPDIMRKNVTKLKTNIMEECRKDVYTLCGLCCAETRFCAAINYKEKTEGDENNCQLTNTTEQKFDENASEKEKVWTFRRIDVDRSLVAELAGEINECKNGGRMIWDPKKPYSCLCKEGYRERLCDKDIDECSEGSHGCHANATCNNTQGSYNCTCLRGYLGNGKHCQNLKDVSEILKSESIEFDIKLEEWLPTRNGTGDWSICWRQTKDGRAGSIFHSNCDGKKPTLTIVQVVKKNKKYVFGGYATESWKYPGYGNAFTSAPGSFLFSLRNNDDLDPFKAPLKNENDKKAIYRDKSYGPCFGGDDLFIAVNAELTKNSMENLGDRYQPPPNTSSFLAGSVTFTPSEVEVLYLN